MEIPELLMTEVFILDAVRTPRRIGKAQKRALSLMHPQRVREPS
jgi:hypothetical protein